MGIYGRNRQRERERVRERGSKRGIETNEHPALHTRADMRCSGHNVHADHTKNVRLEVFTAVTMQNGVFWEVTPCGVRPKRRFLQQPHGVTSHKTPFCDMKNAHTILKVLFFT
jgi:hypothetical protein